MTSQLLQVQLKTFGLPYTVILETLMFLNAKHKQTRDTQMSDTDHGKWPEY
jgi:hypothetical protein